MKVNDNQKVAIYASALQGVLASAGGNENRVESCVHIALVAADEMIKQLEDRKEDNYNPAD